MSHFFHTKTFADRLQNLITQSGYTTSQVGRMANVPKRTLTNWTAGYVKKPRYPDDLLRVCRVLQLSPAQTRDLFELATLPAPTDLIHTEPFHVGVDLPYFVGRKAEINHITNAVREGNAKSIYALVGMAGIGKTSLAWHLAHQLKPYFKDGVLWASIRHSDAIETMITSFALAFGIETASLPDIDSKSRVLRTLLASKTVLIVLDNAEYFEDVLPLLPSIGKSLVLITTQQQAFGSLHGIERLLLSPMVDEAWDLGAHFLSQERIHAEKDALAELIERLGGLPLALTIAFNRLKHEPQWTVRQLLELLDSIHALESQKTNVYQMFMMSYQRLSPTLQAMFGVMGLFYLADIPTDGVAFVLNISLRHATDGMSKLCLASMLDYNRYTHTYSLHPLLWQFAKDLPQDTAHQNRVITFYSQFVQTHTMHYPVIQRHLEPIMYVLHRAFDMGAYIQVTDGIIALFSYLEDYGLLARLTVLIQALYTALTEGTDEPLLATVGYYYSRLLRRTGNPENAEMLANISLELASKHHITRICLLCHNSLGVHALSGNELEQALWHFYAARDLINAHELFGYRYANLVNIASTLYELHRDAEAEQTLLTVVELVDDDDKDNHMIQTTLCNAYWLLWGIAHRKNDTTALQKYQHVGLALARQLQNSALEQAFLAPK
jgi:transcriptional regulator with XRE-family HTH domain